MISSLFIEHLNTILNSNQTKKTGWLTIYNNCLSQILLVYYQNAFFKIGNFLKCKRMKVIEIAHSAMTRSKKM
jgi:hypothetical protein